MAEFCAQCAIAHGFPPEGDFAGIVVPGSLTLLDVLCEGCGPTRVDASGACVFHPFIVDPWEAMEVCSAVTLAVESLKRGS